MTSKQLMVMLNKMYHALIKGKWVDETLTLIADEASKVKGSLQKLGPAPEASVEVMTTLRRQVCPPVCLPARLSVCVSV